MPFLPRWNCCVCRLSSSITAVKLEIDDGGGLMIYPAQMEPAQHRVDATKSSSAATKMAGLMMADLMSDALTIKSA